MGSGTEHGWACVRAGREGTRRQNRMLGMKSKVRWAPSLISDQLLSALQVVEWWIVFGLCLRDNSVSCFPIILSSRAAMWTHLVSLKTSDNYYENAISLIVKGLESGTRQQPCGQEAFWYHWPTEHTPSQSLPDFLLGKKKQPLFIENTKVLTFPFVLCGVSILFQGG